MKVEALEYGDRKVYTVASFNKGVASWLARLPTVWIEGEVTELRRHERWASVFFTLKDPESGACLPASMPRGRFDALRLDLADGERVHVFGRPELYEARAEFRLRALSIERFGLGAHLAAIERLKAKLASEGLFAAERKRPLPRLPRRIGLVTGNDAAAKRDVLTTIEARFPPARVLVAETYVQGPRAAAAIVDALARHLRRAGGRRRRPRPRRRLVRGPAAVQRGAARARGRVVSRADRLGGRARAGHAALRSRRRRARVDADGGGTPRRAGSQRAARAARTLALVAAAVGAPLARARAAAARACADASRPRAGAHAGAEARARSCTHARVSTARRRSCSSGSAPRSSTRDGRLGALSPRATLARGYAIVRGADGIVTSPPASGAHVDVEVAEGAFGATVD